MAGYIGSKASVTQVDGYNRTEADSEFVQVTGDTMTGNLSVTGTVQSTVSTTGDNNFRATSTGGGNYRIYPDDATTANPTWLHQSNSSEDQAWVIGGVERMRLDASGNVGIGVSSPDSILDVRSGSNPQVVLNNTDGTSNDSHDFRIGTFGGSTPYWSSLSLDASSHKFKTYGAERMRIDSGGRVTMPYQPVISGQMGTAMISPSGPTLLAFNVFWVSEGISYNSTTKRFTVPVSGNYRITLNPFFDANFTSGRVLVGINNDAPNTNTHYGHSYRQTASYDTGCINSVVALSANDYIVFYLYGGALYNQTGDRFNQFSIQLIS